MYIKQKVDDWIIILQDENPFHGPILAIPESGDMHGKWRKPTDNEIVQAIRQELQERKGRLNHRRYH
jgi:hypothetical protein